MGNPVSRASQSLAVKKATEDDCIELALVMRDADIAECEMVGGVTPLEALLRSCAATPDALCARLDGEVLAIFGCAPTNVAGVGSPWLLGSDLIAKSSILFLRESQKWVATMSSQYPVLTNVAHCHNTVHLRWLKWLGFEFVAEYEVNQTTVVQFLKVVSHV